MWITFLVYDLILQVYAWLIGIASLFNGKAERWVKGRKNWRSSLAASVSPNQGVVWMHCASLGEFEQGRPVLEALRSTYPGQFILLTFFSPSGYEVRKNYAGADYICYLPLDTPENSRDFVRMVKPRLVIFVKYEFWIHYIFEIHHQRIPLLLISAIFRPQQLFFKSYGKGFREMLKKYDRIFVQDETSFQLLKKTGLNNCMVAGDSRFDRVITVMNHAKEFHEISTFLQQKSTWVAGSTWLPDEKILHACSDLIPKWIIAPHEIDEDHLLKIESMFGDACVRHSIMKSAPELYIDKSMLLIDNIGMLSSLYRYGQAAYIGGGFGAGIHNVPEAAIYGIPVVFGPKYGKFKEAVDLIAGQGSFTIKNAADLKRIIANLQDNNFRKAAGDFSRSYITKHAGATEKIIGFIQANRFLTN